MIGESERSWTDLARREQVLGRVAEANVRLIDLQFSDIVGGAKALTIPIELLAVVLEQGYRFDGAALTGGHRKVELDLFLMPDPETLAIFPFEADGQRRARLCCSVVRRDGQPFAGDPRSVLERNLNVARDSVTTTVSRSRWSITCYPAMAPCRIGNRARDISVSRTTRLPRRATPS